MEILTSATPEEKFCATVDRASRRKKAQFFTPENIAEIMADWVLGASPKSILDPAVGTGILLRTVAKRQFIEEIVAFDVDLKCLAFASESLPKHCIINHSDFMSPKGIKTFDAVIANPPYIRHHELDYEETLYESLSKAAGRRVSRLSNLYMLFVIKCCELLNIDGRASFLIPAEWSNSNFGQTLKDYLLKNKLLKEIVYFNHDGIVFSDNLSTGCLLLIEKSNKHIKIQTNYVPANIKAHSLTELRNHPKNFKQHLSAEDLQASKKWDSLLSKGHLKNIPGFTKLAVLATTKRGIATGANNYFLLSESQLEALNISKKHTLKCIGRSRDISSPYFSSEEFKILSNENKPVYLLNIQDETSPEIVSYLEQGKEKKVHERYLTKARKKWYQVEHRPPSPIWAGVFGRERMKFIYNEAMASNLTAFHCIYPNVGSTHFNKALALCLNSNIVQERALESSRVYGKGLNKFEPKDLLQIEVPNLLKIQNSTLIEMSSMFDKKSTNGAFAQPDVSNIVLKAANEVFISELG